MYSQKGMDVGRFGLNQQFLPAKTVKDIYVYKHSIIVLIYA